MRREDWHKLIVLLFFLPLSLLGYISLTDEDETVSVSENRMLAQKPVLTPSGWLDGSFAKDFRAYYDDQFPLRPLLLNANDRLTQLYSIPLAEGSAEVGGEFDLGQGQSLEELLGIPVAGYDSTPETPAQNTEAPPSTREPDPTPGLASMAPDPTPDFTPEPSPTPEPTPPPEPTPTPEPTPKPDVSDDVSGGGYLLVGDRILHRSYTSESRMRSYADMLNHWQDTLPDYTLISMVVPNSYPFYAPEDKMSASLDQQAMIGKLYDMLDEGIRTVDAYTPISRHTDEYLYFRTDHHWTALGAYYAYTGFCEAMGFTPVDISTWESGAYTDFLGTFYPQVRHLAQAALAAANPDTVEYFIPPYEYEATAYRANSLFSNGWKIPLVNTALGDNVSNKYMAFTNGDQALIHIQTTQKNGRSLLVIKESYGNALIPYLPAHYENVYVLDYRKFNRLNDENTPGLLLRDFLELCGVQEIMLVSYPYVPNTVSTTEWLARLVP